MAAIVGVALGVRLAYELLMPIVPVLTIVAVTASAAYLAWVIHRRRDRW
jgi:hypothetical protein